MGTMPTRTTECRDEMSSVGLYLASASAALEIGSATYAQFINGFPFEDPTLLRIYRWGFLLAFLGLIAGLFGVSSKTPVRWMPSR